MSISDMKLPSGDGTQDIVYQLPHTRHISGIVAEVLGKSFTKERRQRSRKCRAKVRSSDRGNYQHPLKSNFLSSKKKEKRKKEGEKKTIKYVPSNTVKLNVFFLSFFETSKWLLYKNTPTKRMEKDKSSIEILIFICLYASANKIRFSIRRQGKNKPSWVILMVNKRGARYFPNARDRISATSERFDQLYHESVFFPSTNH